MDPSRRGRDAAKGTKPPAVVICSTSQVVLLRTLAVDLGTAARAPYEGESHPPTTSIATREGWHPTGYLARVPRGLRGAGNRAPLRARRAPLHAWGSRRRIVVPPCGHTQGLQALRIFQGGHGEPSLRPARCHRDSAEALCACRVAKVPRGPCCATSRRTRVAPRRYLKPTPSAPRSARPRWDGSSTERWTADWRASWWSWRNASGRRTAKEET